MKALDPLDHEAVEEIKAIKAEIESKISLADEKHKSGQIEEAKLLFEQARDLAIYVGSGPKVRIMNEDSDREMWHTLNKKIESFGKIVHRQTSN